MNTDIRKRVSEISDEKELPCLWSANETTFFLRKLLLVYLSISTASPPLGDYVQVRVSAVLVEEMLLKIKTSHKIC